MNEKPLVRLMPEYGARMPAGGLDDVESTLSPEILARLSHWQATWERDLGYPNEPGSHPESMRFVAAEARELRLAVQAELGEDYCVVTMGAGEKMMPEVERQAGGGRSHDPLQEIEFPQPQGPFWWEELSDKEYNAQGSFYFPPPARSIEQVLDFWRHVQIPDAVLVALQAGLSRQAQIIKDHRQRLRVAAVTQAWDTERPEPEDPAERQAWQSDREQALFEADRGWYEEPQVAWCEDFRSLARMIGLKRGMIDLFNAGFDRDAIEAAIAQSALPWGARAASVLEIDLLFPLADQWIPATPGEAEPAMTFGIDSEDGAAILQWGAAPGQGGFGWSG